MACSAPARMHQARLRFPCFLVNRQIATCARRGLIAWNCFPVHHGWRSSTSMPSLPKLPQADIKELKTQSEKSPDYHTEESLKLTPLSKQLISYLEDRGISLSTLYRNGVRERSSSRGSAIAFPFKKDGKIVACKFRTLDKKFWQAKNGERIFYGLDDIKDASTVIIVEGEIDKLSLEEAGFLNCVSVPNGAPAGASKKKIPVEEDKTYLYVWNCIDYFKEVNQVILATDADPPGELLAEELARRLGRERCWRVKWPNNEKKKCKDANDVLQAFGRKMLHDVIEAAYPYPVRRLFKSSSFFNELNNYFYQKTGNGLGSSTGWDGADRFYQAC